MLDNDPWCDQPPRQQQQRQSSSSYHHPLIRRQRNEVGGGGRSEDNYSFHRAANGSHCVNHVEDAMPSMTPSSPPSTSSSSMSTTTTTEIPHSISSSSTTSTSRATTAAAMVPFPSWAAASSGSAATNAEPFARNVSDPTMTTVRRRPNNAMMTTSSAMEAAAVIGDAVVADDDDEAARRVAQHTPQQHQQAARRQRRRRETAEEALRGVASHLGSYQNPAATLAMRGGAATTTTVPPQQPPRPGSAAARAEAMMRSSASSSFGAAAALCDGSADRQKQLQGLVQCFVSQPIDHSDPKTRLTRGPNNKSVLVLPGLDIHALPQQHRRTSGSNAYDDASIAGKREHPPQGFNLVPPTRPPSMITKRRSSTLSTSSSLKSFGDEESVSSSTSSSVAMASGAEQRRRSTLSSTLPSMMLDGVESSPSLCANNASFSSAQSTPVARMRMAGEAAAVRSSPVGRNSGSGRIAGVKRRYSSSSSSFPGCDTASHIREGAANVFIPPMAASIVPMSSMKFRRVSDRRVSSLSVSSSSSLASAPALLRIDSGAAKTPGAVSAPYSTSGQAGATTAAATTIQVDANASTSTDVTQKEQQSHFKHKSAPARALAACQSYTQTSITHAPSDLLQSISKSFRSLVDARVCSWTTRLNALSSKTATTAGSDEVQQVDLRNRLLATSSSGSECYKVTAVVTQFEILPSPASSNNTASAPTASAPTSSSNGAAAEAHDDDHNENDDDKDVEVVLPIIFESYMDVSFLRHHPPEGGGESEEEELAMTVPLRAPGVITGTMTQLSEPRLTHVQVQLDTEALLTSMSAQARLVVFKAVMGATTGKAATSTSPTGRGSDGRSRPPLFRQASCPHPPIRPVVQRNNSLRSCPGRTAAAAADGGGGQGTHNHHLLKRTLSSIRLSALKRGNRAHSELFTVHHSAGSIGQGGTSNKTGTRKHGLVYSWEQATTSSASTTRSNDGSLSSSMGGSGPLSKRPKLKKDALSSFGRSHRNSSRMSKRNASFAEFGQVHHIHPQHAGIPRLVDGSLRVVPSG